MEYTPFMGRLATLLILALSFAVPVVSQGIESRVLLPVDSGCSELWRGLLQPKITDTPPHLEFSNQKLSEIVRDLADPDTLIVTDSFNIGEMTKIGRAFEVTSNEMSVINAIQGGAPFKKIIAVGGCTALDVAKVAAQSLPVVVVPTLLSTACISVNKGIIRVDGKSKAIKTGVPSRVIIPVDEILATSPQILTRWSRSGFADSLGRLSASVDYQFARGLPLTSDAIGANVPSTVEALDWIKTNFTRYDEKTIRKLAELSHDASSSTIVRGNSELTAGGEHKFYYNLVETIPKEQLTATHGEIVGVGSLIALRAAAEKTGDYRLYFKFLEAVKKLGIEPNYEWLERTGLTRDVIIRGLTGIRESKTFLGDTFKNGDFSILDRIFSTEKPRITAPTKTASLIPLPPAHPVKRAIDLAPSPEKAKLLFGGSFDPPTQAHLRLLVRTMHSESLQDAAMIPAIPYKSTGEADGVNLFLSRVAVEDLPGILQVENIPFQDFRVEGPGRVSWQEPNGKIFKVEVSDVDYHNQIKMNSVATIDAFQAAAGGDPRNLFWLSGTDSFDSINSFLGKSGHPDHERLLRSANWLLIPREESGPTTPEALAKGLPPEISRRFVPVMQNGVAALRPANGREPSILRLNTPQLAGSSTQARAMIQEPNSDLGTILTPNVIQYVRNQRLYHRGGF